MPANWIGRFERDLGADIFTSDQETCKRYGKDWLDLFTPNATGVARPRDLDELKAILACAREARVPLVPSGGRTGLAGGATAILGECILSLERLNKIIDQNDLSQTVRVEAGCVNQALQIFLEPMDRQFPIDLGSKGSCTIGGNIATNAGGLRFVRFGGTRAWIESLEIIDVNGNVMELNGDTTKNNTGYSLKDLLIGSEGTLALITKATVKTVPRLPESIVFLFSLQSAHDAFNILNKARSSGAPLQLCELFSEISYQAVTAAFPETRKLPAAPWYLLLECDAPTGGNNDAVLERLSKAFESYQTLVGTSALEKRQLVQIRERITESLSRKGVVFKSDVSLPLKSLASFLDLITSDSHRIFAGREVYFFGHLGDGNVHINVVEPNLEKKDLFHKEMAIAIKGVYQVIAKLGGSMSAEHGIGLVKRDYLEMFLSQRQIQLMKEIKKSFDPQNLLNPGKIFSV